MDCNLHPVLYWQNNEPTNRIGMRETRHVMGLYEFWDTLVSENPGLKLDICSGTGSRIDFEVMRRAMNLTRADSSWWEPVPDQAKTLGHAPWTPHTGIGAVSDTPYDFRSGLGAVFCVNFDFLSTNDADWEKWRQLLAQVQSLREIYSVEPVRNKPGGVAIPPARLGQIGGAGFPTQPGRDAFGGVSILAQRFGSERNLHGDGCR
jgi:alpha-galactosidase